MTARLTEFSTEPSPLMTAAAARYGLATSQLCLLTDNPADGVYGVRQGACTQNEPSFVLKCTKENVRSRSTLQGQVDWVNFLADHGAPVSRALPSPQGEWVEQLVVEDALHSVVLYSAAPGERPEGDALSAEFFQKWGQVIGQLHVLTTHYTPPRANWRIATWHDGVTELPSATLFCVTLILGWLLTLALRTIPSTPVLLPLLALPINYIPAVVAWLLERSVGSPGSISWLALRSSSPCR